MVSFSQGYIITLGALLCMTVFIFIIRQNQVLTKEDKNMHYSSYNNSNDSNAAEKIISFWQTKPKYVHAVKRIIYLDYLLMFLYGLTIGYALITGYHHSFGSRRAICIMGIVLIFTAILFDALQDYSIHQHLKGSTFPDLRGLTKIKFLFIICSIIISVVGLIKNRNSFVRN